MRSTHDLSVSGVEVGARRAALDGGPGQADQCGAVVWQHPRLRVEKLVARREGSDLRVESWPARAAASALPVPVVLEPLSVPADDRLWPNDHKHSFPVAPSASKESPEGSIEVSQSRPFRGGVKDRELLAQGQVLEDEPASGAKERSG